MKTLSTRTTPDGFKRRRYVSSDGVRHTTIEVPLEVWNGINKQGHAHDRALQWARARARDALRARAEIELAKGVKPLGLSHEIGVPVRTLERWRQQLRKKQCNHPST